MQVVLQKDVKNLGYAGSIVTVKPGYARNFLFPKKLAEPLSPGRKAQEQHQTAVREVKKRKAFDLRKILIEKLNKTELHFKKPADPKGRLFGSVNAFAISKELEKQKYEVDKRAVQLDKPLKNIGEYEVLVDMGDKLKAELKVYIKSPPKKEQKTQA